MPNSFESQKHTRFTFIDLIGLITGVVVCSSAVVTGKNAGRLDVYIGWIVGLLIGGACCWWTSVAMKWVVCSLKLHEPKLSPFRLMLSWLCCLIAILWVVSCGFFAAWLTKLVISNLRWS